MARIVVLDVGGTHPVTAVSDNDGASWTTGAPITGFFPRSDGYSSLNYNGSYYLIAGRHFNGVDYAPAVARSTDGLSWTVHRLSAASSYDPTGVAWNGFVWSLVATSSNFCFTSTDGITWTSHAMTGAPYIWAWNESIVWNGKYFLLIDNNGKSAYSTDGVSWTWKSITGWAEDGYWVAKTNPSGTLTVSPNLQGFNKSLRTILGETWIRSDAPISLYGLAHNGQLFCGLKNLTAEAYTTVDGVTWTVRALPAARGWIALSWNGSKFVGVSTIGEVATSSDGITWSVGTNITGMTSVKSSVAANPNGPIAAPAFWKNFIGQYEAP